MTPADRAALRELAARPKPLTVIYLYAAFNALPALLSALDQQEAELAAARAEVEEVKRQLGNQAVLSRAAQDKAATLRECQDANVKELVRADAEIGRLRAEVSRLSEALDEVTRVNEARRQGNANDARTITELRAALEEARADAKRYADAAAEARIDADRQHDAMATSLAASESECARLRGQVEGTWRAGEALASAVVHLEVCGPCGHDDLSECDGGRAALTALAEWRALSPAAPSRVTPEGTTNREEPKP